MNEHTWTAPAAGRYHMVTGQPPHLLYAECTAECGTLADDGSPNPVSVEFDATTRPTWQAVPIRIESNGGADVEITSARLWTDADGSSLAFVTWEEGWLK